MVNTKDPVLYPDAVTGLSDASLWVKRIGRGKTLAEQESLQKACQLAAEVHRNETRVSGEPYLVHVITVADILSDLGLDTEVLIAAVLHDVPGHPKMTHAYLSEQFGQTVADLVEGVSQMKVLEELNAVIQQSAEAPGEAMARLEQWRKMLVDIAKDVRVVLIKLANRLDNMRALRFHPREQQIRIARETLDLFAPLANRLGIWQIKWELEDLSLRYLEPDVYQYMKRLLDEKRIDREIYIKNVIHDLDQELKRAGIQAEITGRPKHIYSIWLKMKRKGLNFDQIFDIRAVRVLVKTVDECYRVLGIVHNKWQPIPEELDDYIANPKNNNYQSLHTAVTGAEQKIFEVQIRTFDMHHHAELGIASHWRYKEGTRYDSYFEQKIAWWRQMVQQFREASSPDNFLNLFKAEMIEEEKIYVLSPKGKIIELPQGSTPLDFAYAIHTSLGHRCRGAKVNGRIVPLTYVLKNTERVDILAGKEEKPNRDWLNSRVQYFKTNRVRDRIKAWLRKQDAPQHIEDGKQELHRELQRLNLPHLNLEEVAPKLRVQTVNELYAALGRGDITINRVINVINELVFPQEPEPPPTIISRDPARVGVEQGFHIQGVGGLLTHAAGCCHPVPYDEIIGYITVGDGVVVHRMDCYHVLRWKEQANERLIQVSWGSSQEQRLYTASINVEAFDRTGLLGDICMVAANEKVNILSANTSTNKADNTVKMLITVEVKNLEQLGDVLRKIHALRNITKVYRKHN